MLRQLVIVAIVAICLGGPIVELFDRWDQSVEDGYDTETNLVVVALCVGVAFAIGTISIVKRIRALASTSSTRAVASREAISAIASFLLPTPTSSSPIILRV